MTGATLIVNNKADFQGKKKMVTMDSALKTVTGTMNSDCNL